jgi:hypothetical protein
MPSEFWQITPEEFHWLIEAKKPVKEFKGKRSMSEAEAEHIYRKAYGEPPGGH